MDRDLLIFVWIWGKDPVLSIVLIELILMVITNQVIVDGQPLLYRLRTKEGGRPIKSCKSGLVSKSENKIFQKFQYLYYI
jgi:hypothetical protein